MLQIAEYGSLALQIVHFPFSMPVVYRLHPLHVLMWLDCACSATMQVRVAKSWSAYIQLQLRVECFNASLATLQWLKSARGVCSSLSCKCLSRINDYIEPIAICMGENSFHKMFLYHKGKWIGRIFFGCTVFVLITFMLGPYAYTYHCQVSLGIA